MVWSHNDQWMLTADHAGFIKYWQSNMNNVKMYQGHKEPIRSIRWELVPPSGEYLHRSKVYVTLHVICEKQLTAKPNYCRVSYSYLPVFCSLIQYAASIMLENFFYLTQTMYIWQVTWDCVCGCVDQFLYWTQTMYIWQVIWDHVCWCIEQFLYLTQTMHISEAIFEIVYVGVWNDSSLWQILCSNGLVVVGCS